MDGLSKTAIGVLVVAILLLGGTVWFVGSIEEEEARHWERALDEGYSFYVDGSEVEPENVDRNQYEITFDDEANKVFLSN